MEEQPGPGVSPSRWGRAGGREDRAGLQGPGKRPHLPRWPPQLSAKPSPEVRRKERGRIQGMQPSSCGMP